MGKRTKQIASFLLCLCMMLSLAPAALAEGTGTAGSYFDFEASEYEVQENAGTLRIKVLRHGEGTAQARVYFKAADFLSSYGTDYAVLDGDGNPYEKVYGKKPDTSEIVFSPDGIPAAEAAPAAEAGEAPADGVAAEETISEEAIVEETASEEAPAEEAPAEEAPAEEATEEAPVELLSEEASAETAKKDKSRGSALLDAQAAYLNLPDESVKEETEAALGNTMDELYAYFLSAEGTSGYVDFETGETEKTITIEVYDNAAPDSSKIFMLALMGTNTEEADIAPNATTYVGIVDDEPTEPSTFDLVESTITLSADSPTGHVTVRRSGGSQYFSTVYVSTVQETAPRSAYTEMDLLPVGFIPGETEKKVEISASDFSQDASFGIRLESDSGDVGNHYVQVQLAASGEVTGEPVSVPSDTVELMASNVTLGNVNVRYNVNIPGGWKRVNNGDGNGWADNGVYNLYVKQYDDEKYSMMVSNQKQNLAGVANIDARMYTTNVSRGFGSRYQGYYTYFETDTDQSFNGNSNSISYKGNKNWTVHKLSLNNTGGSAYLKFSAKVKSGGHDNVQAQLDWVQYNFAKYSFTFPKSAQNYYRQIYDFSQGTPMIYDAYFEGETNKLYNPGSLTATTTGGDTVSAFYGNNTQRVKFSAANAAKNANHHIRLEGVYFARSDIASQNVKEGMNGVYYVKADADGSVTITPNQNFLNTLKQRGVIKSWHSNETIQVIPRFVQDTVVVNLENTDRVEAGKYDENHLYSHIKNVIEASKKGTVTKKLYNGWLDYYQIRVPKGSVIRVQTQPSADRSAAGVTYWYHSSSGTYTTYYKEGDYRASGANAQGDLITETDYTRADIVADGNMSMRPATGKQTFYVGYSPLSKDYILNLEDASGNPVVSSLENVVIDENAKDAQGNPVGTDADGSLWLTNPYIGKQYNLTAIPPAGYYVSWANLSGDTNNSGIIGDKGDEPLSVNTAREKSENPEYLYGNRLSIKLDQDNTRYYYMFMPQTNAATIVKSGQVVREKNTFMKLADGQEATEFEPVAAAQMNIAGFSDMTDGNGNYSIPIYGLPDWGAVSSFVGIGGKTYNTTVSIEAPTKVVLPAMEAFEAEELSASYGDRANSGSITGQFITVQDDTLTIKATVSSESALQPTNAKFFVYNESGRQEIDCSTDADYTIGMASGRDKLTASLTFNPKQDLKYGYKIYVQFADQSGEWYEPIDLGYTFFSPLNLAEFVFPMIGSTTLEGLFLNEVTYDLIGSPLMDIDMGDISGFDINSSVYTPENIDEDHKEAYTWMRNSYSFGWSQSFGNSLSVKGTASGDDALKKELAEFEKNNGGKPSTGGGMQTQSSFNWSVTPSIGFNMVLSNRGDGTTAKIYFEDLVFFARADFGVSTEQTISLPIGLSILIGGELSGSMAGVYHMYVDYEDSYETDDAVEYTAQSFGLFEKFNNSVRREGYIFIDPEVSIKFGVGIKVAHVTGHADFDFDMDFQFTETGNNAYGSVDVDMGWGVEVLGFEVYSKDYDVANERIFNTAGTNGHIEFDYQNPQLAALQTVSDYLYVDPFTPLETGKLVDRSYLENRTKLTNDGVSLLSVDATTGSTESTAQTGVSYTPGTQIIPISDSELLMVFLDHSDKGDRIAVNDQMLYYTIITNSNGAASMSEPKPVHDDGTYDAFPFLYDMGDRILIAWSSADKVHSDGANLEEVLPSMDIQTKFFKKSGSELDENVAQLTKNTYVPPTNNTEEHGDWTADIVSGAAYDSDTGRLILYYTKTEYDELKTAGDLTDESKNTSVLAYLFYESQSNPGWQIDGSVYSDEELYGMTDAEKAQYKTDWYGQRFLDTRTDTTEETAPRVADSAAETVNGLSLFAWTVDWDRELETVNDRDVFMQIYEFSSNTFTHIIRVTDNTGTYMTPKFARSGNAAYLFYGELDAATGNGEIKYINVSEAIGDGQYREVEEESNKYYVLEYARAEYETTDPDASADGTTTESQGAVQTTPVEATLAASCNNLSDYDLIVTDEGQMYLVWTDTVDGVHSVMAATFTDTDKDDDNDSTEENDGEVDYTEYSWSEPFLLQKGGADTYYNELGAAMLNDKIFISGVKAKLDNSQTSLVRIEHTPFARVETESISLAEDAVAMPGGTVDAVVTLRNAGMLPATGTTTVTLKVNGTAAGTKTIAPEGTGENVIAATIPGGDTLEIIMPVTLPDSFSTVTLAASTSDSDAKELQLTTASSLSVTDGEVKTIKEEGGARTAYLADIENTGNADAGAITVTAYIGTEPVGTASLTGLGMGEKTEIDITLDIPDSAYTITDGVGIAEITVKATEGGAECFTETVEATKRFSAEAIALLAAVTGITFEDGGAYTAKEGEELQIQPTIEGVDEGKLRVEWLSSSNGRTAYINYSNVIVTEEAGTTTLTGLVVPVEETVTFDAAGNAEKTDWTKAIPENLQKTVTATVTVKAPSKGTVTQGGASLVTGGTSGGSTGTNAWVNPFNDVKDSDWFYPAVEYASVNGLFNGVSETEFAPNGVMTRAMLVTVLHRAEGEPEATEAAGFADVPADAYYAKAVAWAEENGIVNGFSETEFGPDLEITREQIAAIMERYADYKGLETTEKGDLAAFTDSEAISEWAVENVEWAVGFGLISGRDDGTLDPLGSATRAEVATILQRFLTQLPTEEV